MTKCIKHIRDLFQYALYKFTLYLLTSLLFTKTACAEKKVIIENVSHVAKCSLVRKIDHHDA